MISQLRKVVAGPKNRTVTQDFDLDFTYITDTVVAMAFPATGIEQAYRNSITDVAKFLEKYHSTGYLIINVSNRKYEYKLFKQRVKQYVWEDHQAPTLHTLFQICYDSFQFLKQKNRIVCFHCNHGKGRTGTSIICLFMYLGFFKDVDTALKFYNKRRFNDDNYGVCQPCQVRSMQYFLAAFNQIKSQNYRKNIKAYKLIKIQYEGIQGDSYQIMIYATRNQKIKHNKLQIKEKGTQIQSNIPLMNDVYIELKAKGWVWDSIAARANINMNYCQQVSNDQIVWTMQGQKVRLNANQHKNFTIKFYFQQFCKCDEESDWACPCQNQREIQQKEWEDIIKYVKTTNGIQSRDTCKILFPSQVIDVQQEGLEVKTQ